MMRRIDHDWRWLGTALSFLLFGAGGIFLSLCIFPVLRLMPGAEADRQRRAKRVVHHTFLFYIHLMRFLGVLDFNIEAASRLRSAKLVLANHPSLLDVVFMIALIPNATCIVKGRLTRHIWTRGPVQQAGYILNEADNDVVELANRAIERGDVLIIFPEGTRTTPGKSVMLKRGAAQIAVRCRVDITPVIIRCQPSTLTKKDRWYQVPDKRVHFDIRVNPEIVIAPYLQNAVASRAARSLTAGLTHYFNKEVSLHEQSTSGTEGYDHRSARTGRYNAR